MTLLPEVEQALSDAIRREHRRRRTSRLAAMGLRPRLGLRPPAIAMAVTLTTATIALAAGGVLTGSPVPGARLHARSGTGLPVAGGHRRLLSLRAADPQGGLRWGMRIVRTTRGEVCIQVARVQHGRLGELGIDGAFHDDRLFHPLPASALPSGAPGVVGALPGASPAQPGLESSGDTRCVLSGHAFAVAETGVPSSAAGEAPFTMRRTSTPRWPRRVNGTLPSGQLRNLYYGLLGPQAVSVSYRDGAAERTVPAAKATGAYLIVAPVTPGRQPDGSEVAIAPYGLLGPGRGEGLTKITYRIDGRLCERGLQSRSGAAAHVSHPCPTPPRPRRSHGPAGPDLHVPLHVRLQIAKHIVTAARVSFKAPYSVSSARAGYLFFLPQALCHRPGHFESAGNAVAFVHDVHRAGTVSTLISHPFANPGGCRLRSVMIQAVYQLGLPPRRTVIGETTIRRPPPARRSGASAR